MQLSTGWRSRFSSLSFFFKVLTLYLKTHFLCVPQNKCSKTCSQKEGPLHPNFPFRDSLYQLACWRLRNYTVEKTGWFLFNLVFPNLIWPEDCLFVSGDTSYQLSEWLFDKTHCENGSSKAPSEQRITEFRGNQECPQWSYNVSSGKLEVLA